MSLSSTAVEGIVETGPVGEQGELDNSNSIYSKKKKKKGEKYIKNEMGF